MLPEMTVIALKTDPSQHVPTAFQTKRSSLLRLYLIRGLLALAWAGIFFQAHITLDALAITLLIVYPLIDAVSSLVDFVSMQDGSERRITAFNALLSTVAAIAMGVAGNFGVATALVTFGAWAVVAGAAQFVLGLRRRGNELGRQWPMLIAGGLSFLVGIDYAIQAAGAKPSLNVLAIYATGGGAFFIIQAGLLAWRSRQQRQAMH